MKKRFFFLSVIALCGLSNFSSAQYQFDLPVNFVLDEPIGIDLTVKTAKLSTGVTLQYAEQGNLTGTPVIFLHGLSDSWHSFESVLNLLPNDIHAFALSQRGHGDSERPLAGYTPKDFAADVASFIKLNDLQSAYIVGHSLGGVVAQQFALDYPQLTKGLVIVSSAASWQNNPGVPEFYEQVQQMKEPMDKTFMHEFQKGTLTKPINPAYYNLLVAEGMKVPVSIFKAALSGVLTADYTAQLKNIKAPVLIMWGAQDNFCTEANQEEMVKEIRQARFFVYEGTGHALHWEEPARFVKDLTGFISKSVHSKM